MTLAKSKKSSYYNSFFIILTLFALHSASALKAYLSLTQYLTPTKSEYPCYKQ